MKNNRIYLESIWKGWGGVNAIQLSKAFNGQ